MMYRFGGMILLLLAVLPFLHTTSFFGHASMLLQPVSGGAIPANSPAVVLDRRADSPTAVCQRWAQMSAVVNGTLYLYGGQATTESSQTENTWNNNFLSLHLTKTWQIATPALDGLPQPSGPPNVSLGSLWNSYDSLFLYGGEFSWKPAVSPTPFSLWEYDISEGSWIEHSDPTTATGVSAPSNDEPVQRAAEGAGVSVPSIGRAFYFGGHLDGYTTQGWSQSVARVYLQSLLEYTFPGYTNNQISALNNGEAAPAGGDWRNVTEGGVQSLPGFTERADGLLVYVPGFGAEGILLAMAGGTNESFTQMNNINVYDIANSTWYIQATTGETPNIRVNPCATIAAAQDGSSYNIYMFGGQNLIPYGNQTQYDDMWILTLPSFTWIKVDQGGQSVPPGRSGHTCNVWDAQMVMVGGYTGDQTLTCESPGVYVFDMSNLQWVNQFTSLSRGQGSSNSRAAAVTNGNGQNPLAQQAAQKFTSSSAGGLQGSFGYLVPQAVIDVVGGNPSGSATLTTPVNTATAGPLATGKPITYDISNITQSTGSKNHNSNSSSSGTNVGAIVAGCVAGVLFLIACYLAFCTYVYRKQLQLYKRHVEMSQAQARGEKVPGIAGLLSSTNQGSSGKMTPSDSSYARGEGAVTPWLTRTSDGGASSTHRRSESGGGVGNTTSAAAPPGGYSSLKRNSNASDGEEDLLAGREPSFVGVMVHPRRSLRVINRD
ncbi:kelch repeat protein [Zymoseptoria brevis]|uniref:Kelch repeat protein n=1 Tax=Zymoseptoria brevis TaxID=1047168 RepID=A0A0F4GJT2_9PEZI|nr:kelch repeat protein [Zymoseptoria brevis]